MIKLALKDSTRFSLPNILTCPLSHLMPVHLAPEGGAEEEHAEADAEDVEHGEAEDDVPEAGHQAQVGAAQQQHGQEVAYTRGV